MIMKLKLNNEMEEEISREKALQSPEQLADHLRVTAVPTYLLAAAIIVLLGAFVVWGFLGNVSDKAYYSGVVFPVQGTIDLSKANYQEVTPVYSTDINNHIN